MESTMCPSDKVITPNCTDLEPTSSNQSFYVETHSPVVITVFTTIGLVSCASCSLAIAAMTRTKRIPFSTKFLSCGLLLFDCLFIVISTVRKCVREPAINVNLHVAAMICIQLSFMTVALMSAERYLLFVYPERYPLLCSKKAAPALAFMFWIGQIALTLLMRYLACLLANGDRNKMLNVSGYCNNIITIYYMVLIFVFLTVSLICYGHIIKIIRNKTLVGLVTRGPGTLNNAMQTLKRYQSTSLVLIYVISITMTSLAYFLILVFIRCFQLGIYELRMSTEVVSIVNCLIDPYLYVIWFRETRLELLKMISPCNYRLRNRVEVMRYDIFDIVMSVKRVRDNRVHPGSPKVKIRHV